MSESTTQQPSAPVLVVGAGIAGITAAVEAAEAGRSVVLVEKEASVGGRVLRIHNYFPKLCPPSCGMEINTRRLERSPRIRVITQAQVLKTERQGDGHRVTLKHAPEYIKGSCTACGECAKVCPSKVQDPFNLGMGKVSAVRLPHADAWPRRFVLDREACSKDCKACADVCQYGAVDLAAEETEETLDVAAMVVATGWEPYPIEKLPELGGGVLKDVVANVQMERMTAPAGPTAGKILRPSDGQPPKKVAFVQCAGSRDVNHLPYCSAVCCLASLKQALYVREQLPETEVTLYYIDRRTPGRNEEVLTRVAGTDGVRLVKGKVGKIERGAGDSLLLRVEDVDAGKLAEAEADLVVLATGMVPCSGDDAFAIPVQKDDDGFGLDDFKAHVFVAGVARRPEDVAATVRDATGAAAKASMAAGRSA